MTTDTNLRPGCFASALLYRAGAVECVKCPVATECRTMVLQRIPSVFRMVRGLDTRFQSERTGPVAAWIKLKMKAAAPKRVNPRPAATLEGWKRAGVNVYHLKHARNPMAPGSMLHAIFASILKAGPFKTRDIVEEIRAAHPTTTKAAMTALVKNTCDALLLEGILKRENRGVLCLS